MATPNNINDILAESDGMVREDEQVLMPAYQLRISGELVQQTEHPNSFVAAVHFQVSHPRLFPDGLADCSVGMGETLEASGYVLA